MSNFELKVSEDGAKLVLLGLDVTIKVAGQSVNATNASAVADQLKACAGLREDLLKQLDAQSANVTPPAAPPIPPTAQSDTGGTVQ